MEAKVCFNRASTSPAEDRTTVKELVGFGLEIGLTTLHFRETAKHLCRVPFDAVLDLPRFEFLRSSGDSQYQYAPLRDSEFHVPPGLY